MRKNSKYTLVFMLFAAKFVFADSPITSTEFYSLYLDLPLVQQATKTDGNLSQEMMVFLGDENQKLEHKIALINAIGWDHKNNNSKKFLTYIIHKRKYAGVFKDNDYGLLMDYGTPEEQICYAYLKANEDYFNLSSAFEMANQAKMKSNSFGVHFVFQLIKAQIYFSIHEHCQARKPFLDLRDNKNFKDVFQENAMPLLLEYVLTSTENCLD